MRNPDLPVQKATEEESPILEILRWLVKHAEDTEWQTRNAAEDRDCSYCATPADQYESMKEHRPGCEYVATMERAKQMLHLLESGQAS